MGNLAPPFFIHDQEAGVRCRQAKEMMAEASPGSSAGEVGSDVGDQGGEGFRETGHAGEGKGRDTRREERIRRAVWPSDCHPPRSGLRHLLHWKAFVLCAGRLGRSALSSRTFRLKSALPVGDGRLLQGLYISHECIDLFLRKVGVRWHGGWVAGHDVGYGFPDRLPDVGFVGDQLGAVGENPF